MHLARLSSRHYAYGWPVDAIYPVSEVNKLGLEYALLPEGKDKQEKGLELIQKFHNYLMKYVSMIKSGHLPLWQGKVSRDTENMLRYFIPRGTPVNKTSLGAACRTLHLAFKQMDVDEVYDVLVQCFLKAIAKYDPKYTEKMAAVVRLIQSASGKRRFSRVKRLSPAKLNAHLDFDCSRLLRVLVRRGYLEAHIKAGKNNVKKVFYERTPHWPPPAEFLNAGPIGLTYFIQRWYKYFLQEWIDQRMSEIESKDGVFQLEHRNSYSDLGGKRTSVHDLPVPHTDGNFTGADGRRWSADMSLMNKNSDLGELNLQWVVSTNDKLFCDLSTNERHLLYLLYVNEMPWADIAATFDITVSEAKRMLQNTLSKVRAKAASSAESKDGVPREPVEESKEDTAEHPEAEEFTDEETETNLPDPEDESELVA